MKLMIDRTHYIGSSLRGSKKWGDKRFGTTVIPMILLLII